MLDFLGNSAVQFVFVIVLFCSLAVCSCVVIEKLVGYFFPIGEEELRRIMNAHPKPPGAAEEEAPAPCPVPPVLPHVIIQIDPPESDDEEVNELSLQETPILSSHSDEEYEDEDEEEEDDEYEYEDEQVTAL